MTKSNETYLPGVTLKLPVIPIDIFNLTFDAEIEVEKHDFVPSILPFARSEVARLPIKYARFMTSGDDVKTVVYMSLNNTNSSFQYQPGDSIGVLPENNISEVDKLIKLLNISCDASLQYNLTLKNTESKKKVVFPSHLPPKGRLRDVFTHYIDIRSILKKVFICALSTYTGDALERRKMEEICSREGTNLYTEEILNKNTSILDILERFTSCHPPVTLLLQHLPRLSPRPYSICSSSLSKSSQLDICFSVICINDDKKGVATGWLEDIVNSRNQSIVLSHSNLEELTNVIGGLKISDSLEKISRNFQDDYTIPVYLRTSTAFRLPKDDSIPIIMIGPGTGVAPFIGFLEERRQLKIQNLNQEFGTTWLYFGCRYSDRDFLFKEELYRYLNDGTLSRLMVSHSREAISDAKYVQDNILLDAEKFVDMLLNKKAIVYICGDLNTMGKQVADSIIQCFKKVNSTSDSEGAAILKDLKDNNQYILDIWV